jgi:hypothetical protein
LAATPALLPAQYFGQNKVQYRTFDFEIIQTEHFDVYFYQRERDAAMDAAIKLAMDRPKWRLTLQAHKVVGLP